jgi:holo-[acyl-carrier protein] synthase
VIKGCGIDIVEIARIERLIDKYQRSFLDKVFTEAEIDYCGKKARPAVHFSGRWAVKEAFYKAVPVECQKYSTWHSIEVLSQAQSGKPEIELISSELQAAFEEHGISQWHTSISHERSYCVGQVYLEGKN